jgi:hypothetical protein
MLRFVVRAIRNTEMSDLDHCKELVDVTARNWTLWVSITVLVASNEVMYSSNEG